MLDILQLNDMLVPELRELAEKLGLKGYKRLNKQELIYKILDQQAVSKEGGDGAKEEEGREEKSDKGSRRTSSRKKETPKDSNGSSKQKPESRKAPEKEKEEDGDQKEKRRSRKRPAKSDSDSRDRDRDRDRDRRQQHLGGVHHPGQAGQRLQQHERAGERTGARRR